MNIGSAKNSYRVERHPHGVLIFGSIPFDDLFNLSRKWSKDGFGMDIGVAWALRATLALASPTSSEAWRKAIAEDLAARYPGDLPMQWLHGTDVGASSCWLFVELCDPGISHAEAEFGRFSDPFPVPHDEADWGRCQRMLDFLGWQDRFRAALEKLGPAWARWVKPTDEEIDR